MTACGAARFQRPGGPAAIPFRACCAAALVRAGGCPEATVRPSPFICRASGAPMPQPGVDTAVPAESPR